MPFNFPLELPIRYTPDLGSSILARELLAEKAATLGRVARQAEQDLKRLRDHDAGLGDKVPRDELVQTAASAVWRLMIQRELCGYRDPEAIICDYDVPREVLARVGAR